MKSLNEYIFEKLGKLNNQIKDLAKGKQVNIFIKCSGSMDKLLGWATNFANDVKASVGNNVKFYKWDAKQVTEVTDLSDITAEGPGASTDVLYDFIADKYNTSDTGSKKWLNIVVVDSADPEIVRTDKEVDGTYFYVNRTSSGHKSVFAPIESIMQK